jgi:hypothetical protein
LYGGTAIALQLGHRPSLDFDFFAWRPFAPNNLMQKIPYLRGATVRQAAPDTLTVTVDRGGPAQLLFFGGLDLGQVARADTAIGPGIKVASLIDLAGFKVAVVTQRAELKDYIDVHTLLIRAAIPLADMLASAGIIYGSEFIRCSPSRRSPTTRTAHWPGSQWVCVGILPRPSERPILGACRG